MSIFELDKNAIRPKASLDKEVVVVSMSGFGANISSLRAQRILASSTNELSRINERLASGQRINRSSDDAAGLAIASSLNSKSRIYGQSIRNINDGISALSIAGGVTESLSNIIVRLKELAEQAANGSYSSKQRSAMDGEAQALRNEYNRLVDGTTFNGIRILNQNTGRMRISAGETSNAGALYINPNDLRTGQLGNGASGTVKSLSGLNTNATKVRSADFNQDGYQDIVAISPTDKVAIKLGNGDGTFKATVTYDASLYEDAQVADINNDGTPDIVLASNDFKVLLGNGDGTFRNGQTGSFSDAGNQIHSIALKDFNGDGRIDIAAGDGANVLVNAGTSTGGFSSASMFSQSVYGAALDIQSVKIADFDGDGKSDIAVGGLYVGSTFVLFGNNNGTFTSALEVTTSSSEIQSIAVGDLNGDGRADIAAGGSNGLDYFSVNTNRTVTSTSSLLSASNTLEAADLNGDGKLDLLTADGSNFTLFAGNGNGTFAASTNYYSSAETAFALADLNGDSVLDTITLDGGGGGSILLTGTSDASYLNSLSLATRGEAFAALRSLDSAQTALGLAMGRIGADQSRLEAALNVVRSTREGFSAAESRIKDADMANEAAGLAKTKILQETTTNLLSTINLQPSLMLQLLKST